MSKKKKNPRAIREISKLIKNTPVYKAEKTGSKGSEEEVKAVKTSEINPTAYADLKKVTYLIVTMIILLAIVTYLVYKTEVFAPLFEKFHLSY